MLKHLKRATVILVAIASIQVGMQNMQAAEAATTTTSSSANSAQVCEIACVAGALACCALIEGACYFCGTNYDTCVATCLVLPI